MAEHTITQWEAERDGDMLYIREGNRCVAVFADPEERALRDGIEGTTEELVRVVRIWNTYDDLIAAVEPVLARYKAMTFFEGAEGIDYEVIFGNLTDAIAKATA